MSTDPAKQSSAYGYYNYGSYDDDSRSVGDDDDDDAADDDKATPVPPNCAEFPTYNRKTRIYFKCGSGIGNPMYMDQDAECTYLFTWESVYACPLGIPPPKSALEKGCNVLNDKGQKIDLSPLMRPFDNWVVEGKDRVYTLAVCGNLVPTPDIPNQCQGPRAFACSAPRKGGGGEGEATAIGRNLGMWARQVSPSCPQKKPPTSLAFSHTEVSSEMPRPPS